ncbi:signal recognition particle protein [Inquilinus limosus]|uniref:Signal recognition particle protein n=1 Tax=Inquilinus limosus MP06 TaxID=1398085 RepID=A0A0A0D7V8_9PROT|nr:signal recognition particle protein [Inquilinus limosus]KGM34224.1 RNA-binding protein [Inquilinus limosus MP06]
MFEGLSGRLGDIFDRLRKRGALTEADVGAAMREVRVALLEADVALPVVKDFIDKARERAVGAEVLRSVTPGQQVIKIVHDCLVEMLGGTAGEMPDLNAATPINLIAVPPVPVLMVGLQGSGKTTTTGKIALRLKDRDNRRVLMASLDTRRPAAQEQLKILGEQIGVTTLPIIPGQEPLAIARRAMERGRLEGFDVVLLDTAGRLAIDEELMAEVVAIRDATKPTETLLVADAMTGQDAVNVARTFHERVGVTGIVLTRVDGDSRGGAALSMRAVTGQPIKLIGMGEKMDALELFHPDRIANRILGMGDVVSLVEKAAQTIEKEDAEKLAAKIQKGEFDLEDLASQLRQMRKMGGLQGLMGMLPGVGKIKDQMKTAGLDDKMIKRQEAIISSMTPTERRNPKIIHAKRKVRIAAGSGSTVQDVNKLLKQHQQMADMMKRMKKLGKAGLMRGMPKLPPGMLPPGFKM